MSSSFEGYSFARMALYCSMLLDSLSTSLDAFSSWSHRLMRSAYFLLGTTLWAGFE